MIRGCTLDHLVAGRHVILSTALAYSFHYGKRCELLFVALVERGMFACVTNCSLSSRRQAKGQELFQCVLVCLCLLFGTVSQEALL